MRAFFSKLRIRLMLLVFLAALPSFWLILHSGLEQRKQAVFAAEQQTYWALSHACRYQDRLIDGTIHLLETLAEIPQVKDREDEKSSEIFESILKTHKECTNIGAADLDGNVVASGTFPQRAANVADREYFRIALQSNRLAIGDYVVGRITKVPSLNAGYPIHDRVGKTNGVIFTGLNLDELSVAGACEPLPRNSTITVTDGWGTVLYDSRSLDMVGKPFPCPEVFEAARARGTGMIRTGRPGKQDFLHVFGPISSFADVGYIFIELDEKSILLAPNRILVRNIIGLGAAVLFAVIVSFFLGFLLITRKVNVLINASKQLSEGDLTVRTGLGAGCGEIDRLASVFDEMAETLAQREAGRRETEKALSESEERFRLIIETSNEGIWVRDRDDKTTFVNRVMAEMIGCVPDEILGKPFTDFIYEEDIQSHEETVFRRSQGSEEQYERRMCHQTGREVWTWVSAVPMFDGSSNYIGSFGMFTDITDRKLAEQALLESEARLRQIIDLVPHMIFVKDWEGKFLLANEAVAKALNSTVSGLTGKCHADFHPDKLELQRVLQDDREVITRGEIKFIPEEPYTDARGNLRFLQTTKVPFRISRDRRAVLGIAIDTTEHKRAEDERARLVTAIEQVAEGIMIADANFIIQYVNPAFERTTGFDRAEIIGRHTGILKSKKNDRAFYENIRNTLTRGEVWSGRVQAQKKDGTLYDVEARTSPVRDESGNIINYITIRRDITLEMKLEKELRQAQKMESIGTLAGGIAHDFNNILTAIIGYTEMALTRIPDRDPARNYLDQVITSGYRARDLVKQILTFSRQTEQERKPVQIAPIVKEALKLLRSSLPTTVEIRQEIAVNPVGDIVMADPTQIHQVLMNLCTNAFHAMRDKGGILNVVLAEVDAGSLCSEHPELQPGSYVSLTVNDTGCGMDASVMERIFDPYFTTKAPGEGTGLGLSVVQGIVRSHNGIISVQSLPGVGTSFRVLLPLAGGTVAQRPEKMDVLPVGSERILFVDDEKALVDLGKQMLEGLGYRVSAQTSSLDALEIFRSEPDAFDLVITDLTMPGLTGIGLARKITSIRPRTPVILCTGFSDQNEDQAETAGVCDFIMKPYVVATLAGSIRKVLVRNS
jgi:PAS domain S-box-containing protein